jgi:hypothetical protein
VTAEGRGDRFVPLDLDSGFNTWFSTFVSSWRFEPALWEGQPVECWVVYSARASVKVSTLVSTEFRTLPDRTYNPDVASSQ